MTVDEALNVVKAALARLEPLFDERCLLTFVARAPHLPDGDMVVTQDDIDAVIASLTRQKARMFEMPDEGITREGLNRIMALQSAGCPHCGGELTHVPLAATRLDEMDALWCPSCERKVRRC